MNDIDERLDVTNRRLDDVERRFGHTDDGSGKIDEQLSGIHKIQKNLTDAVKDMKLWLEARFERLEAGQADIRADFAELRRDLAVS